MRTAVPKPRFELKYRINEHLAVGIDRVARFHLEPDKHSREGDYVVNSLYLDTPDDRDAQETDEGIVMRSKVRLRCYTSMPRPPFFLELKQRFGSSIYKTRAVLEPEDAERLANGQPPVLAYGRRSAAEALNTIREVIDRREMTPRVWVKYARCAWTSPWGDRVRMTIDRGLETQAVEPCTALSPSPLGWSFPELDDRPVLEFKFFGSAPRWMQRLAREFELDRTSCSKYGMCLCSIQESTAIPRLAVAS
jgi:hypothetical protein